MGGEQQAPRERVDRRAAHHRVAVEVAVEGGEVAQVGEEDQQHRRLVESLGEPGAAAPPRRELRRPGARHRFGVAVGDRGERREPGLHLRQVLVPAGQVEVAQRLPGGGIAHHDHVPRLAVAAVGREPGGVEQPVEDLVGHRVRRESRTAPVVRRAWLRSMARPYDRPTTRATGLRSSARSRKDRTHVRHPDPRRRPGRRHRQRPPARRRRDPGRPRRRHRRPGRRHGGSRGSDDRRHRQGRHARVRRRAHPLRRAGVLGRRAHAVAVARCHHRARRQLRLHHRAAVGRRRRRRLPDAHAGARRGHAARVAARRACRGTGRPPPSTSTRSKGGSASTPGSWSATPPSAAS